MVDKLVRRLSCPALPAADHYVAPRCYLWSLPDCSRGVSASSVHDNNPLNRVCISVTAVTGLIIVSGFTDPR
jgi:hypothetical protein